MHFYVFLSCALFTAIFGGYQLQLFILILHKMDGIVCIVNTSEKKNLMNGAFALELPPAEGLFLFDIFSSLMQYYKQYTLKSERYLKCIHCKIFPYGV